MTGKHIDEIPTKEQAWDANQKVAEIHRLLNIDIDSSLQNWKYAYVDLFITMHRGNLAAVQRDLGVSYRTLTYWMYGIKVLKTKSRGRAEALKTARSRRGKPKSRKEK